MTDDGSHSPLRVTWGERAERWIEWVRADCDDSYRRFHREAFLDFLPAPGRATLDLGCGEGRLTRELARRGHSVVGVDASARMITAAQEEGNGVEFHHADALNLPFPEDHFDLVVAFMALHAFDDLDGALREVARVLDPSGCVCLAIVHPLNSSGAFAADASDAPFVIPNSYLAESHYDTVVTREGATMLFRGIHRPIQRYSEAFAAERFVIDRLLEVGLPNGAVESESGRRWQRVPLFLHIRASLTEWRAPQSLGA